MSDGSGGAPQLDERALEAAKLEVDACRTDTMVLARQHKAKYLYLDPYDEAERVVRAYLAASLGAGELDLTDGEVEAVLRNLPDEPGFHLGFGGNFNAAVAKLRARLDRKDDEE